MIKTISKIAIAGLILASFTGCDKEAKPEEADFRCKQNGELAPKWTCTPFADDAYAGTGSAEKSGAGMNHMRRVAIGNARVDLAEQIKVSVKAKLTNYVGTTGAGNTETVDAAVETITKQVAKVDLAGSKQIDSWTSKDGTLFVLVSYSETAANKSIKKNLKTSFNNDQAQWQQFKSKNALESLEKEFD